MKDKYISSLKVLDLTVREANDLIRLMEKYNPEDSFAQALFYLANTHKQLLSQLINNHNEMVEDYSKFLMDRELSSLVVKIKEDSKKRIASAELAYDKINAILSYTSKF